MSLTRLLIQEVVADKRKKQALQRIAKVLYKSYNKNLYNEVRKLLSNPKYLNRRHYKDVGGYLLNKYRETPDINQLLLGLDRDAFIEAHWLMVYRIYDVIKNADPTHNGAYINWLVSAWFESEIEPTYGEIDTHVLNYTFKQFLLLKGGIYRTFLEDTNKVKKLLVTFEKAKELNAISGAESDINRYGSVTELFDKIQKLEKDPDMLKSKREQVMDQSEIIYEDAEWKFVVPRTHEASCAWGSGTNWCTAVDDGDSRTYNDYMQEGDLVILINDRKDRKFQAHYATGTNHPDYWFMNERDEFAIDEFLKLVGQDFHKYMGIIVWHEIKDWVDAKGVGAFMGEFDALCDELNQQIRSEHFLPVDFLPDEVLKTMLKEMIRVLTRVDLETEFREKRKNEILETVNEFKTKGIRKIWLELMSNHQRDIINDLMFNFSVEFTDTKKAIQEHFESLMN